MSANTLWVVEDDEDLRYELEHELHAAGYRVTTFFDGPPVIRHVQDYGLPHLIVIDIDLPTMDGLELSTRLKERGDVPIIFLTAKDGKQDIIRGLAEYAADDYITKPFMFDELLARIERVLSRIPNFNYVSSPIVEIDDRLAIDFGNSRVIVVDEKNTREDVLTPIEANLLHILLRYAGYDVASETLMSRVWPREEIYEDTLRVHIHRLRRKLEVDYRNPQYILTVRGIGYRFVRPIGGAC